ncbi:hypothetical protein [Jeotgalibaca arthritidis]|uniref:hypothetical protein n=1 Tax=Jeotgalibaca arthritidis TaxID=1868794 RepID=UPI0035A17ACA
MRRKTWTEDEEIFLFDNVGKLTFKKIGIELGRSESSVANKAKILGVKILDNQGFIDGETFCETIGISRSTFEYWRKAHNFPAKKRKDFKYLAIDLDKFWNWAKKNKKIINWTKFETGALGVEPRWVREVRKNNRYNRNKKVWELDEDEILKRMIAKGATYPELSKVLKRSHASIRRRIYDLYLPPPARTGNKRWTEEEVAYAVEKLRNGADLMTVAADLGRSESGLREKLIREGYTFNKRMINSEPKIKKKKPRWTEDELSYMFEKLQKGVALNILSSELGRTEKTVRTKIERMGYTYQNRKLASKRAS